MLVLGLGLGLGLVVLFYLTNESTQKLCLRNSAMRQRFIARLRDNVRKLTNDGMREWDEDEGGCCVCVFSTIVCSRNIPIHSISDVDWEWDNIKINFIYAYSLFGIRWGKIGDTYYIAVFIMQIQFCVCVQVLANRFKDHFEENYRINFGRDTFKRTFSLFFDSNTFQNVLDISAQNFINFSYHDQEFCFEDFTHLRLSSVVNVSKRETETLILNVLK